MDAGQLDEAIPYLREGVRLWTEAGNLPKAGNIYNLLGLLFRRQGVQDSALNAYEQAIDAFGRAKDSSKMGILYKNLAAVYTEKGDIQESIELNRRSLELNQRFGSEKRIAASHQNLGIAYSRRGDIAHAIEEYQKALSILEDMAPSRGLINLYYSLANIYIELEDMTQAEFFFMKGIRMADSSQSIQNQAFAKTSMASWYLDIKKYPEALASYEEALDFITENQFMVLLSTIQAGMGQTLFEMERLAEAEKWLKDALTTSLENGRAYQIVQSYLFLSRIAWEKRNVNLAGTYAEKGLSVAQDIQELKMTADLAEILVNVQKEKGNYAEALRMRELAIAMSDSSNTEEKKRAALRLEFQYNYEKMALQDSLENVAALQLQQADLDRRTMTNWLLAGFLLLALASAMLLFNRFRVTRQQKQIIEGEKAKLDQANGDLNTANAKLKELDDFKSHFFTNISHEFRTPLTVINGMARQIRREPTRWLDKGADMIERNSDSLLHLVNQILDLRKLEAGKLNLHLIQDDVIAFVRYNTGVFESLAQSRGVSLSFESKEEAIMMDFDPEKLSQVLQNLLSNAIKFTPEEGKVSCWIGLRDPHMLEIQVRDTGMGIAAEKLSMIFDRFYQVDSTDTRQEEGTGIGLSLTKELVQLMDGRIHVESQENIGTMFQVLLPVRQEAGVQAAAKWMGKDDVLSALSLPPISQRTESLSLTERPKLLIIEDNPDVVTYLHSCLEETYELLSAFDGEEGIEIALESVPDLIITDVMMPKKNGYQVTEILKYDERTSHIPIVMLTAKADQGARIEGYKRGADAYLTKPFDQEELSVRLEKLWEIRQTLQKRYQGNTTPTPTEDPAIQQEDAFIQKVRGLVMSHLDDTSYKVDLMLKDLGISRTNFHRKIKALTGKTPSHFIRSIRVHHAQQLLRQSTDMQISEVAYAVGFADPAYFGRVFHEITGTSPGEWREKHKN